MSSGDPRRIPLLARLLIPASATVVLTAPVLSLGVVSAALDPGDRLTASALGAVYAGFFMLSAATARPGSRIAARYGTTRVLVPSMLLCLVANTAVLMRPTVVALVVVCLVSGLINGIAAPAVNLLVLWLVPPERHGIAFGIRAAAIPAATAGAASFVAVSAWAGLPWQGIFAVGACAALVIAGAVWWVGTEEPTLPGLSADRRRGSLPFTVRLLVIAGFFGASSSAVIAPFLALSVAESQGSPLLGASLLAIANWMVIAFRLVLGHWSDRSSSRHRELVIVAASFTMSAVGMALLAVPRGGVGVVAAGTFLACVVGWSWPGMLQRLTLTGPETDPARATGMLQTASFAGCVVGPFLFGLLARGQGFSVAWAFAGVLAAAAAVATRVAGRVGRVDVSAVPVVRPSAGHGSAARHSNI